MSVLYKQTIYRRWGLEEIQHKIQHHQRLTEQEGLQLLECPHIVVVGSLAHLARTIQHQNRAYYTFHSANDLNESSPNEAILHYPQHQNNQNNIEHILKIRDKQDHTHSLDSFTLLPHKHSHTQKNCESVLMLQSTLDLKLLAVCRIMLDNIQHIKVYCDMLHPQLAQLALLFGADTINGIIIENSPQNSHSPNITKKDLEFLITQINLSPIEYSKLPAIPQHDSSNVMQESHTVGTQNKFPQSDPSSSDVDSILSPIWDKILAHQRITLEDAKKLYEHAPFYDLAYFANKLRRHYHPESYVTYLIDRVVNYSNICVCNCKFCCFSAKPNAESTPNHKGYVLNQEELITKIDESLKLGARQILLQGGLHPNLPLSFYEEMLRLIRAKYPTLHIHAFSAPEIVHWSKQENISIAEVIQRLYKAGLDTIPGDGADILSDEVRQEVSPHKCSTMEWLSVMEEAHRQGIKTTATMMGGYTESIEHRLQHLSHLRELQDRTHSFSAFILWTFLPNSTTSYSKESVVSYLRFLAIARMFLDNFSNLEASRATMGTKIAQIALYFGANDFGSAMIAENIPEITGSDFCMSAEEIQRLIFEAGFVPLRRNMAYEWVDIPKE